jgi:hypothetical protein
VCKKVCVTLLLLLCGAICAQAQTENITIVLKGDRPLVVDEVSESSDGYWYKRGNVTTFLDRERVVRVDDPKPAEAATTPAPLEGNGKWKLADAQKVQDFFFTRFKKSLPLTAFGHSDLHTRW